MNAPIERRRKRGQRPLKEGEETVTMGMRLTAGQRAKLSSLGGSAWVRDKIDRANESSAALHGDKSMTLGEELLQDQIERLEDDNRELVKMVDRLQRILDSRPAINAGLPETYIEWSQGIYACDYATAGVRQ